MEFVGSVYGRILLFGICCGPGLNYGLVDESRRRLRAPCVNCWELGFTVRPKPTPGGRARRLFGDASGTGSI